MATAWHLLALTSPRSVDMHLFDGAGLAGGASGAAAGLLHPFSPKGKVRCLSAEMTSFIFQVPCAIAVHQMGCHPRWALPLWMMFVDQ